MLLAPSLFICKICSSEVKRLYNFKKKALNTREILERYVKTLTNTNNIQTVQFHDLKVKLYDLKPYLSMVNYSSVIERIINSNLSNVSVTKDTELVFGTTIFQTKSINQDVNNKFSVNCKRRRTYDSIEDNNIKSDSYICSRCDKKFKNLPSLRHHYNNHIKRVKYTKNSGSSNNFRKFKKIVNDNNKIENNRKVEKQMPASLSEVNNHIFQACNINENETSASIEEDLNMFITCSLCNQILNSLTSLHEHMSAHHSISQINNTTKIQQFNSENRLTRKTCNNDNTEIDNHCSALVLQEHSADYKKDNFKNKTNTESQLYTCDKCDLTFKQIVDLRIHNKSHKMKSKLLERKNITTIEKNVTVNTKFNTTPLFLETRVIKIEEEDVGTINSKLISNLEEPTTNLEDKLFACNQCNETFREITDLKKHYKFHESRSISTDIPTFTKMVENTAVNKNFDANPLFLETQHIKIEEDDVGDINSSLIINLDEPTTELEDKSFACNQCSETFKELTDLEKHYKLHKNRSISTDIPTFTKVVENTAVNENFDTNPLFLETKHIKIEEDDVGDINSSLIINLEEPTTDLQDKSFACNQCGETFKELTDLEKHYKFHENRSINNDIPTFTKIVENANENFDTNPLFLETKPIKIEEDNVGNINSTTLILNLEEPITDVEDLRKHDKCHEIKSKLSESECVSVDTAKFIKIAEKVSGDKNVLLLKEKCNNSKEDNIETDNSILISNLEVSATELKKEKSYACSQCCKIFKGLTTFRKHYKSHKTKLEISKSRDNSEQLYENVTGMVLDNDKNSILEENRSKNIEGKSLNPLLGMDSMDINRDKSEQVYKNVTDMVLDNDNSVFEENCLKNIEEKSLNPLQGMDSMDINRDISEQPYKNVTGMVSDNDNSILEENRSKNIEEESVNPLQSMDVADVILPEEFIEKPCECNICGKKFNYERHLEQHLIIHKGEEPYSCDKCGKTFQWLAKLRSHCKKVHENRKIKPRNSNQCYSCKQCDKKYKASRQLKVHIQNCHTMFYCEICSFPFNTLEEVNKHTMIIHNLTGNDWNLKHDEIQSHSNSSSSIESLKNVKCKFCAITVCSSLDDLAKHVVEEHCKFLTEFDVNINNKPSECYYCNITFNSLNDLSKHLAICDDAIQKNYNNDNIKIIKCRLCNTIVISEKDLTDHMLAKHNNISSNNENNLLEKCLRCNITLNSKSDLTEHMTECCKVTDQSNTNDNSNNIKCSVCNIILNCLNDLSEHMSLKHNALTENNISLKCHICNIQVKTLSDLKEHMSVQHNDVPNTITMLKCNLCNILLCSSRDFVDHMLAKHNMLVKYDINDSNAFKNFGDVVEQIELSYCIQN